MGTETRASGSLKSREQRDRDKMVVSITFWPESSSQLLINSVSPHSYDFGAGDINDLNQRAIKILDSLRKDVQQRGIDLTGYKHSYLDDLAMVGRAAYNKIFSAQARKDIEALDAEASLQLTLTVPPTLMPFWELLYTGNILKDELDPRLFWGLRYPLGSVFLGGNFTKHIEMGEGIFSASHQDLDHSQAEIKQLAALIATVCQTMGINIKLSLLDELLAADSLTTKKLMGLLINESFPYGMIHFACHCKNTAGGASNAYLCLTAHGQELEIPLLDLTAYADEETGFPNKPFIFLNACETQTPQHLLQTISLPNNLIRLRAGGVIATACTMPDNFASAFAAKFYEGLLNRTEGSVAPAIAEVLLETRLYFLREHNNPLGLAYGLYARSDQELRL